MDSYQSIPQIPWGGHSPISSLYHQQQQQQGIQEYKSESNSLYGSPYTPIIHTPDISPVASPEPDGKSLFTLRTKNLNRARVARIDVALCTLGFVTRFSINSPVHYTPVKTSTYKTIVKYNAK